MHTKGGVINFADGHAAYWKTAVVQAGGSASGTAFELPDLLWSGTRLIETSNHNSFLKKNQKKLNLYETKQ